MDINLKTMLNQLKHTKETFIFTLANDNKIKGTVITFDNDYIFLNKGKLMIDNIVNIKKIKY